jgi:hypothetical protein
LLQIIVHTTGYLIAQKIHWRGQSERIVRLSTAKCYREYLIDAPVDNEYQQITILATELPGRESVSEIIWHSSAVKEQCVVQFPGKLGNLSRFAGYHPVCLNVPPEGAGHRE